MGAFWLKRLVALVGDREGSVGGALKVGNAKVLEGGTRADSGGVFGRFLAGSDDSASGPEGDPHFPNAALGEAGLGFTREGEEEPAGDSWSLPSSPCIGAPARGELRAGRAEGLPNPMPNGEVGLGEGKVGLSLAGEEGGVVLDASTLRVGTCSKAGSDGSCADFPLGVSLGEPGNDSDGVAGSAMSAGDKRGDSDFDLLSGAGVADGDLENGKGI